MTNYTEKFTKAAQDGENMLRRAHELKTFALKTLETDVNNKQAITILSLAVEMQAWYGKMFD